MNYTANMNLLSSNNIDTYDVYINNDYYGTDLQNIQITTPTSRHCLVDGIPAVNSFGNLKKPIQTIVPLKPYKNIIYTKNKSKKTRKLKKYKD
jgi:hypothetical protein